MAKMSVMAPFVGVRGALSAEDSVYFRECYGKVYGVRLKNPRKKFSAKETAYRAEFGRLQQEAKAIYHDQRQREAYAKDFRKQKQYKTLFRYIVSRLRDAASGD